MSEGYVGWGIGRMIIAGESTMKVQNLKIQNGESFCVPVHGRNAVKVSILGQLFERWQTLVLRNLQILKISC